MKIQDASLATDSQIQSAPTTQLPTGLSGDLATNFTQIKNYVLNQIGFAPLFDSNSKGQATDLNAIDLNSLESAGFSTSGLYSARANCTNNPTAIDGLLLWLRGHINYQSQLWMGTDGTIFYRNKPSSSWSVWSMIELGNFYGVASGTDTYAVAINGIFSLYTGLTVRIKFTNAPTGSACTLNINALGAKTVQLNAGYPIENGSFAAGEIWQLTYDGTNFIMASDPYVKTYDQMVVSSATGTDTYICAATGFTPFGAYIFGSKLRVHFANANTGASTLNVNSVGAKSLVKNGSTALAAADIKAGQFVDVTYDGTNFQILGKI